MNGAAAQTRAGLPGDAFPAADGPATRRPPRAPLWLCLGLPQLPLEVRSGGDEDMAARIIVDSAGRVVRASRAAAEQGVASGLPLNAALALCPGLAVLARDEAAEQAALARLAAWAGAFTSVVSLAPPAALLLEVRGSLQLFGGLEALRERLRDGLRAAGYAGRDAVAPTPLAALWLARARVEEAVTELAALASRLGPLRPAVTGWPVATMTVLRSLGVESLADCLRLPRDGFARRVGRGPLADLDRALGRLPDPRAAFSPPSRYRGELELATETSDTARMARAMDGLFTELEGFLRARQRAVSRLAVRLRHLDHPVTALTLGLAAPGLEAARFSAVFVEQLERLALPAPVISVALEAEPDEPLSPGAAGLFGDAPGDAAGWQLIERLQARLGSECVHGLAVRDEHRPERAWAVAEPGAGAYLAASPGPGRKRARGAAKDTAASVVPGGVPGVTTGAARPAWLLESPRPLRTRAGRPCFDGTLVMERGPERLETGWWDGQGIARDYWIARTPAGARLWIYRQLDAAGGRESGWFLHGVFG